MISIVYGKSTKYLSRIIRIFLKGFTALTIRIQCKQQLAPLSRSLNSLPDGDNTRRDCSTFRIILKLFQTTNVEKLQRKWHGTQARISDGGVTFYFLKRWMTLSEVRAWPDNFEFFSEKKLWWILFSNMASLRPLNQPKMFARECSFFYSNFLMLMIWNTFV